VIACFSNATGSGPHFSFSSGECEEWFRSATTIIQSIWVNKKREARNRFGLFWNLCLPSTSRRSTLFIDAAIRQPPIHSPISSTRPLVYILLRLWISSSLIHFFVDIVSLSYLYFFLHPIYYLSIKISNQDGAGRKTKRKTEEAGFAPRRCNQYQQQRDEL
jgi:hypothetical protein